MGLGHNTTIVRNGLVFYYDASNTEKSWRGEPTTNLYDFGYYQAEGGHTATRTVGDAPGLSTSVVDYHTITTSGSWITESARLIIWPTTTLAASTTFRVSFWARVTSKGTTTIKSAFYGNAVNNSHSLTTSWQRFSYSSTTHSLFRALEFGSDDGAITFQIAGIQWESKSVQTPYVKTSRSNTQAILDLTNNNTITANSLTYNANGTFSFVNASENYISFPYTQSSPNNFTVEAWIYHTAHSSDTNIGHTIVIPYSNYNSWIFSLVGTTSRLMLRHHNFNSSTTSYNVADSSGLALNTWFHVLATDNSTNVKLYVNGQETTSSSSAISTTNGTMDCRIGSWPTSGTSFDGQISSVKIYNRALTATEVLQNFNAQRDRYGI